MTNLPIKLAVRLFLDDVSYSNPLPPWSDVIEIDYVRKAGIIADLIDRYGRGQWDVQPPLAVDVPGRSGRANRWLLPSINEQIVLQACIADLAEDLEGGIDRSRVYSRRLNKNEDRLGFVEDQFKSWFAFKDRVRDEAEKHGFFLYMDLERAFPSVPRSDFFSFLRGRSARVETLALWEGLLTRIDPEGAGIPFVNDGVFYVGDTYFTVVDEIVIRHTMRFVRWVDDYYIFGRSEAELHRLFERINKDLQGRGFRINEGKIRLGSASQIGDLGAREINRSNTLSPRQAGGLDPSNETCEHYSGCKEGEEGFAGVRATALVTWIQKTLLDPDRYLNESFARWLMALIRRFRFSGAVATLRGKDSLPFQSFRDGLAADPVILPRASELLASYGLIPGEAWRTIWILYLLEDVRLPGVSLKQIEALAKLGASELVRLWAKRLLDGRGNRPNAKEDQETIHAEAYLSTGRRLYGGSQ